MSTALETSVIFVIDPPILIPESIILVGSLRRFHPDVDIQAYCPIAKNGAVPTQLAEFFDCNNVKLNFVSTEGVFSPDYPHGNKLIACSSKRATGATLFLDTDIMAVKPLVFDRLVIDGQIGAAPEGRRTWGKPQFGQHWSEIYAKFDLPLPEQTVRLARTGAESAPYFNAGVVAFKNCSQSSKVPFARCWLDTAKVLDADKSIVSPRPWLDQISLPVAAARQGLGYNVLSNEWNLSLSRKSPDNRDEIEEMDAADPYLVHYHRFQFLTGTRYASILDEVTRASTAFESFEELMLPYTKANMKIGRIERQMEEIRAVEKQDRTREDRAELARLKKQRHSLLAIPAQEKLASWPSSILP